MMDLDSPWDESPSLDSTVELEWTRISSQFTNVGPTPVFQHVSTYNLSFRPDIEKASQLGKNPLSKKVSMMVSQMSVFPLGAN